VGAQVHAVLDGIERVRVSGPLAYPELARLLSVATLVLSDSGGIQEEAPSFGVPVLVLRKVTERMEAVAAGCALLVGTDRELIVRTASHLLTDQQARAAMTVSGNPFGDGRAAERTEQSVAWLLGLQRHRPEEFRPASNAVSVKPSGGEVVA
jgi:UDP-N-acetylglucosamine 2-epimerase (non-hydrolysing)